MCVLYVCGVNRFADHPHRATAMSLELVIGSATVNKSCVSHEDAEACGGLCRQQKCYMQQFFSRYGLETKA